MARLSHQDYTVGWICALSTELTAAIAMLEEEHSPLSQDPQDNNTYTLGRIGVHNVVIACLPAGQMGNNSAAMVASQMRYSFGAIRFGLMVGIGGGVPSEEVDIRLGDVVVSNPGKHDGGVIQYDFGRTMAKGRFVQSGLLNAPPTVLLTAVSTLKARHNLWGHQLAHYLSAVDTPRLRSKYTYQGTENDVLFKAEYDHVGDDTSCDQCDMSMLVSRPRRDENLPSIHYGTIASGNQVMRHGKTRERWRQESDVLCFEMEAAGLMNSFPCLVIRGICDYADSHKNKQWQEYAAATAAAYAKELLCIIPGDQVAHTQTMAEATSLMVPLNRLTLTEPFEKEKQNASMSLETIPLDDPSRFLALSKRPEWDIAQEGLSSYDIFEHISDYEPDRTHRDYLRNRCPKTTSWILEDKRFIAWLESRSHPCLWLSGKIGCGKTLVTSTAVQHMIQTSQNTGHLVAQFFYSHSNKSRLKAAHLFRSYIKQILAYLDMTGKQPPLRIISYVKRFFGPKRHYPGFDEIIDEIFIPLSNLLPSTVYVVDGLDECQQEETQKVVKTFQKLMSQHSTRVFISGREALDVANSIPDSVTVVISDENNREDICRFIEWKIGEKMRERQLTEKKSVLQDIRRILIEKADRMILWVSLQLEALWDECYTDTDIENALANMPKDLSEIYDRCLTRISRQHNRFAKKILPWVCVAIRPFTVSQLREALAIDSVTGCLDQDNMPSAQELLKCCSNLIIRDCNDQVLLAHYSVRQFLEDRTPDPRLFPTGIEISGAGLELGKLCVAHLTSPNYALALQPSNAREGLVINASPVIETVVNTLGRNIPYLGRLSLTKPRPVRIPWPPKASSATPVKESPSFFHFAKEQWAPLTHEIAKGSDCWDKFRTLALEPNLSWRMYPWEPLGESLDSHFSSLLGWAIVNRHLPLLDLLFGLQNPKPRAEIFNLPFYHYSNLPPLHLASRVGHVESTQRLLQVCNPKKTDGTGRTALHHAAETGHTDVALLLFKQKVNLNTKDYKGQTALHLAAGNGHDFTVRVLVELGASINGRDNKKWTSLFMAAANEHTATVQALVELGAEVNAKDNAGRTALFIAAVRVLAKLGAEVNAKDDTGQRALYMAVENGHEAAVRALVQLGAEVNGKDSPGRMALLWAAGRGHEAVVKLLLAQDGLDPDFKDEHGRTPLSWAAENGHEAVAKLLLAQDGVDPDSKNKHGRTPLSWAAENGHEAVVKLLLAQNSVDPDSKSKHGRTPLSWAVENGHEAVVKLLLAQNGVNPDSKDEYGQTPLSRAAEKGHEAVVKLLLAQNGVNPDSKNKHGRMPLSWAAEKGHEAVVKLLLAQNSVDPDSRDEYGQTPISWAAEKGHEAVVKLLLAQNSVNPDSKDEYGQTPISWAAEKGYEAVVKLLLAQNGVNSDSKDEYGQTPLSWAAEKGHEAVVKLLLAQNSVDPDSKDKYDQTPLSWAAEKGHEAVVKLLLAQNGVDPDSKNKHGRTPLSWAAENGHEAVVKLLLAQDGVELDSKDKLYHHTPLSWAAEKGHEAVVKLLLAQDGVELDSKDRLYHQTPLSWAAEKGHEAVVKLLLAQNGVDPDSKSKHGQTPISWAAEKGHEAVVKLLLAQNSVDPDSKDKYDQTPISWAAEKGHEAVVKLLLAQNGVDPYSKNKDGQTPLSRAAENGHEAVVKLLLATGRRRPALQGQIRSDRR